MIDLTNPLLRGDLVRLDAITPDDLPTVTRWFSDPVFMRLFDARPAAPRTLAAVQDEITTLQKSSQDFTFAIRRTSQDAIIGVVTIDEILWPHRVGGLAIGLGSAEQRGQGFGTEAGALALRFAFQELNLHRITVTVFRYNTASLRMVEKLGFVQEGVFREFLERDGQRHDMLLFGLLRPEWQARQTH